MITQQQFNRLLLGGFVAFFLGGGVLMAIAPAFEAEPTAMPSPDFIVEWPGDRPRRCEAHVTGERFFYQCDDGTKGNGPFTSDVPGALQYQWVRKDMAGQLPDITYTPARTKAQQ